VTNRVNFCVCLVILAHFMSGCATELVPTSQAWPVPKNRLLTQKWRSPTTDTGSLIVKRDRGLVETDCFSRVYIEGVPVADLDASEMVEFFLPAGEHILEIGVGGEELCEGFSEEKLTGASVIITKGRQKVFRIKTGTGGTVLIPTTP